MDLNNNIKNKIESHLSLGIKSVTPVGGGCINDSQKITLSDGSSLLLKFNSDAPADMFCKEANGLSEIRKSKTFRIPNVILYDESFILLEFIQAASKSKYFFEDFGRNFASMHKFAGNEFGFYEDNYIGSNIQKNIAEENEKYDWIKFYFNKRIMFQFKLAEKNGYLTRELSNGISNLENKIEAVLSQSIESPSLLHGDLWSGNYILDENGSACLIDPAVYYGHREADLAMTKLFGGFNSVFYASYNESSPLPEGYSYRENIYKLYHVLNHLNLFGSGYYAQTISLLNSYL